MPETPYARDGSWEIFGLHANAPASSSPVTLSFSMSEAGLFQVHAAKQQCWRGDRRRNSN